MTKRKPKMAKMKHKRAKMRPKMRLKRTPRCHLGQIPIAFDIYLYTYVEWPR